MITLTENYHIHHLALRVSNLERSLAFYQAVLGLRVTKAWGEGEQKICLAAFPDGTALEIFAGGKEDQSLPAADQSGRFFHLAVAVEDTDAAVENAVAHGARVRIAPQNMDIPSDPVMPVRIAFVYGPDGEELEFFQQR